MKAPPLPTEALLVQRRLPVPPVKVFEAFTDANRLARWFAPADAMRTVVRALDARPGGEWRVDMIDGDRVMTVGGTYREVRKPDLLVFTWRWEGADEETLVRVELVPVEGGCEIILTHERFATEASKVEHGKGWDACLRRLPNAWGA